MRPLGATRCRVLSCLGADNPKLATFFNPTPERSIEEALQTYLATLHDTVKDPYVTRIAAAGLLTFGELSYTEEILLQLPQAPIQLDHGAGWCPLLPYSIVAELLPLPGEFADSRKWTAGSSLETALLQWFRSHREHLVWDPLLSRFVSDGRS